MHNLASTKFVSKYRSWIEKRRGRKVNVLLLWNCSTVFLLYHNLGDVSLSSDISSLVIRWEATAEPWWAAVVSNTLISIHLKWPSYLMTWASIFLFSSLMVALCQHYSWLCFFLCFCWFCVMSRNSHLSAAWSCEVGTDATCAGDFSFPWWTVLLKSKEWLRLNSLLFYKNLCNKKLISPPILEYLRSMEMYLINLIRIQIAQAVSRFSSTSPSHLCWEDKRGMGEAGNCTKEKGLGKILYCPSGEPSPDPKVFACYANAYIQVFWCVFLPEVKKNNTAARSLQQSGNTWFVSLPLKSFWKGQVLP